MKEKSNKRLSITIITISLFLICIYKLEPIKRLIIKNEAQEITIDGKYYTIKNMFFSRPVNVSNVGMIYLSQNEALSFSVTKVDKDDYGKFKERLKNGYSFIAGKECDFFEASPNNEQKPSFLVWYNKKLELFFQLDEGISSLERFYAVTHDDLCYALKLKIKK